MGQLRLICELGAGEDGDDFVAALLDVCAAAFFSVHQQDNESDLSAGFFDRIDCLNGRSTRGDYIVNYDD